MYDLVPMKLLLIVTLRYKNQINLNEGQDNSKEQEVTQAGVSMIGGQM